MLPRLLPMACVAAALGSVALAQQAPSGPTQTLPGWGGTPAPQPGQTASPGGLVAIAPGSVVVTYYEVKPVDMTASNLLRTEVRNLQDERIGRIEDLVIGGGREIAAIVIGVGGFLGIGERYHPLPWSMLRYDVDLGGYVVDLDRDQLEGAPSYAAADEVDWADRQWGQRVSDYYGVRPYWSEVP